MKSGIAIVALALLGACGGQANDSGVTAEESQALNETEAMLDEALDGDIAANSLDGDIPANSLASGNEGTAAEDVGNLGDLPVVSDAVKQD